MSARMRRKPETLEVPGLAYYSSGTGPERAVRPQPALPITAQDVIEQMFGYYTAA